MNRNELLHELKTRNKVFNYAWLTLMFCGLIILWLIDAVPVKGVDIFIIQMSYIFVFVIAMVMYGAEHFYTIESLHDQIKSAEFWEEYNRIKGNHVGIDLDTTLTVTKPNKCKVCGGELLYVVLRNGKSFVECPMCDNGSKS